MSAGPEWWAGSQTMTEMRGPWIESSFILLLLYLHLLSFSSVFLFLFPSLQFDIENRSRKNTIDRRLVEGESRKGNLGSSTLPLPLPLLPPFPSPLFFLFLFLTLSSSLSFCSSFFLHLQLRNLVSSARDTSLAAETV